MLQLRRAAERGHTHLDWLDSRHTFSFADYYDPAHMGIGVLRVLNDDRVAPGAGFPTHSHQNMEIVTYVLDGALEHKDSLGNGSVIVPGDVQRMSAGTGVRHSEYNASRENSVHFLQIWIIPARQGIPPGYEQKHFEPNSVSGRLRLIASHDGREDSVLLNQDAAIYATRLADAQSVEHAPGNARKLYVHVARGSLDLNGQTLGPGDGAALVNEPILTLTARADAEALIFDLP